MNDKLPHPTHQLFLPLDTLYCSGIHFIPTDYITPTPKTIEYIKTLYNGDN